MILPVPVHDEPTVKPAQELRVAMRLLSGKDCTRDASTAQMSLLRLAEGRHGGVSQDAEDLLRIGAKKEWFAAVTPHHFELERIATRSEGADKRNQMVLTLVLGLSLLLAGLVVFFAVETVGPDVPWLSIAIVALAIIGLAIAKLNKRQ